jgi:phosphohistidine phosphatase SixA
VRALETAEIVARRVGRDAVVDDRLAGGFGLESLNELLEELHAERPMLVGHDPDFSELLSSLCAAAGLEMKKGALARIDLRLPVRPGCGTLAWLVPPRLVGDLDLDLAG